MKRIQKIILAFTLLGAFTLPLTSVVNASPLPDTIEALEAKVAELEVELVGFRLAYTPDSPEIKSLEHDLRRTRARLAQQRPNGSAATAKAIIKALNEKINEAKSVGSEKDKGMIDSWRQRRTDFYKRLKMIYEQY